MADRGRDLKFSILTDLSDLETTRAAQGLEDVGDAAKDAGRDLDRLQDDAKDVDLGRLGSEAKDAAKDIDSAFDRIRRSSSAGTKALDDDARKAGEGFDNLKEEAGSTGREAAASFSGSFDDIAGGIQEVAANAFAGFGPAGAAAGLAAAAGIGLLVTAYTEAKERVRDLAGEIIDQGGRISEDGLFARIADAATEGQLQKLTKATRTLGIDVTALQSVFRDSSSARSFLASLEAIGSAQDTVNRNTGRGVDVSALLGERTERNTTLTLEQRNALNTLREATRDSVTEFTKAEAIARDYEAITGHSIETVEAYADVIGGLTDAQAPFAAAVEDSAKRQAAATKSTEDSWQDYADTALASIDDVITKQLEQLSAGQEFQANMAKVLDRVGQDGVDWALAQGENAERAMQLLAAAPVAKAQEVADNYAAAATLSGQAYAAGLAAQGRDVNGAAAGVHAGAAGILGRRISIPVDLNSDGIISEAERVRADIQSRMRSIVIPILAGPFAGTVANARDRW